MNLNLHLIVKRIILLPKQPTSLLYCFAIPVVNTFLLLVAIRGLDYRSQSVLPMVALRAWVN